MSSGYFNPNEAISLLTVAAGFLVIIILVTCCSAICLCCCCGIQSWTAFFSLFCCFFCCCPQRKHQEITTFHTVNTTSSYHTPYAESYGTDSDLNIESRYNYDYERESILFADAYLVAPLAEARFVENQSILHNIPTNMNTDTMTNTSSSSIGISSDRSLNLVVYNDVWIGVLFVMHLAVISWFSITEFLYLVNFYTTDIRITEYFNIATYVLLGTCLILTASLIGIFVITLLINYSTNVIEGIYYMNTILLILIAMISFLFCDNIYITIIFLILAFYNHRNFQNVKSQIPFFATILQIAYQVIKNHNISILVIAISLHIFEYLWVIIWSMGAFNIYRLTMNGNSLCKNNKKCTIDDFSLHKTIIIFILLFSFYWGFVVLQAILQTTIAGVVSYWWFKPYQHAPVRASFYRSVTVSFGSLCLGSIFVSFFETFRLDPSS